MARILVRAHHPYFTGGPAENRTQPVRKMAADENARFEQLLISCLEGLGHIVRVQVDPDGVPDRPGDAKVVIAAHRTRREGPGDLFYKQMHLPSLFTIDHLGWGADHSGAQAAPDLSQVDRQSAADFLEVLAGRYLAQGRSKQRQPARGPLDLPRPYVFVPTQMPYDYVIKHHSPTSVTAFVRRIAQWADRRRQNVVVKLHPGLRQASHPEIEADLREAVTGADHLRLSDANVHDLVAGSIGVFAINSGVGFESLIHGKPVATFGDCDYSWVTHRGSLDRLDDALGYLTSYGRDQWEEAARFLWWYHHRHAYSLEEEAIDCSRERLVAYLRQAIRI